MDYLLIFINKLLYSILDNNTIKSCLKEIKKSEYEENNKVDLIKYIDYKFFIDKMKKESNIKFLNMTIKDFLSNKISKKFKTIKEDSNSKIIEDYLLKLNNEILSFIFNIKLGDWLDVFLYKKEFEDLEKMNEKQIEIIMNSFQRVDKLLINIIKRDDADYVSRFIYYMYNFERWFLIKFGRNKKNSTDNNNFINNLEEKCKNDKKIFTIQKYFDK